MESKKINGHKMSKKEARKIVYDKLVLALAEFNPGAKNKKFENNLRRTSKLFAPFMIKAGKDKAKPKKTVKAKPEQKSEDTVNN